MSQSNDLVCSCRKCRDIAPSINQYYPVYSFGKLDFEDGTGKPTLVVGVRPSSHEYIKEFLSLSNEPAERCRRQRNYFTQEKYYTLFFKPIEDRFQEPVEKTVLDWNNKPWEIVGFTDLVKCPVTDKEWTKSKDQLIENCKGYLIDQIQTYRPKLIVTYGEPALRWFSNFAKTSQNQYGYSLINITSIPGYSPAVAFLYQARRSNIKKSRDAIIKAFKLLNLPHPF